MDQPFEKELFAELASLEDGHFWFEARNRVILWALHEWFPDARSFLEVGCGTGFVLAAVAAALPRAEIRATDLYPQGLVYARQRVPRAEVFQSDARTLACAEPSDVVGAFDVLEHIEDDDAALAAIARCADDGGGLIATVPQHPRLWSGFDEASHHVRRYRRGELEQKVASVGFTVVHSTSFVSLLLPLLVVARRKSGSGAVSVGDVLRRTEKLNAPLAAVMHAEFALLRRGVRFGAGGSRLIVARKGHGLV